MQKLTTDGGEEKKIMLEKGDRRKTDYKRQSMTETGKRIPQKERELQEKTQQARAGGQPHQKEARKVQLKNDKSANDRNMEI